MKTRETPGGAQPYADAHRRRNKWRAAVICMAILVVFCTVYAPVMPAATLEGDTYCGTAEHTHTEECYESVLSCELEEGEEHTHDESCYEDVLTCGFAEHTHTAECYVNPEEAAEVATVKTSAASTLAVGDTYQLSYRASWSTGGIFGGSTVSAENTFQIIIVDGSGNAIDVEYITCSEDDNTISYTQSLSDGYYSLSSLASYFTVEVDGTTYVYSGAKVGSSNNANSASSASRIRYNGSNWQRGTARTSGGGGQNQNISWTNTDGTTIYLVYTDPSTIEVSTSISGTFGHIDVKTAAAYTGDESHDKVTAIQSNQLTYTTTRTQQGQTTTVSNIVNLEEGDDEWTHDNSGNFDSTTTITIVFSLDATSSSDLNATWYTSTITADTTYPDNTYYPADDGDQAYKLYNYIYGANLASGDPVPMDIDISGMSVFLVSAIVCNGSTVSGQNNLSGTNGLDLVLNVATLLSASPNFDFAVEKTLQGSNILSDGQFSFIFQKAEKDTDSNIWTLDSEATGTYNQELETEAETATEEGATSITQTIGGAQVTYSTRTSTRTEIEYYILQEVAGADSSVDYDTTVYGIAVTLETNSSSSTGTVAGTTYTTTITSVEVYKLTANETGGYTQAGEALNLDTDYTQDSSGVYVFPFTNTMTSTGSLTITKEVSGATVTNKDYTFTISTTTDMTEANPMMGETSVTFEKVDDIWIATVTVKATTAEGKDGTITITGLPLGSYTVTEVTTDVDINGYRFDGVTYQVNDDKYTTDDKADVKLSTDSDDSTTAIVNATNEYTQVVDITVTKVDAHDTNIKLSGATFYLKNSDGEYYYIDEDTKVVDWVDSEEDATELISEDDGTFTIDVLENGTYYLVEVAAPGGYQLPSSNFEFTVTSGKVSYVSSGTPSQSDTITITNTTGEILPETGGAGTTYMTISGLLIMAAAVGSGYVLRRRREKARN